MAYKMLFIALMKEYAFSTLLVAAMCVFSPNAQAVLIGDNVVVAHHFPTVGTIQDSHNVAVEAGTGDLVTISLSSNQGTVDVYTVNVESSSILVNFLLAEASFADDDFNGLIVSSLDWVGDPAGFISDVTVDTNISGWSDATRLVFDDHSARFNFDGLTITDDNFLNATLIPLHMPPDTVIPEPATMTLMGLGMLCLGMVRRFRS